MGEVCKKIFFFLQRESWAFPDKDNTKKTKKQKHRKGEKKVEVCGNIYIRFDGGIKMTQNAIHAQILFAKV